MISPNGATFSQQNRLWQTPISMLSQLFRIPQRKDVAPQRLYTHLRNCYKLQSEGHRVNFLSEKRKICIEVLDFKKAPRQT